MIQAKCIEKFRNKQGKIYAYRLIDLNGQTQDVDADKLKEAIDKKLITIINLTLTSDNRLVDTSTKQLQSSKLGHPPIINKEEHSEGIRFDKSKRPYDANSYEEFMERLAVLLSKTLNFYDNRQFRVMYKTTDDEDLTYCELVSKEFSYNDKDCKVIITFNDKYRNMSFCIYNADNNSRLYTDAYRLYRTNMKADFSNILKKHKN